MEKITNNINAGIFWGCFDPPTLAHKAILLKMGELFQQVFLVIRNISKTDYFAPIEQRLAMLSSMLPLHTNKYKILIQDDPQQNNYFDVQTKAVGQLFVVVGMDALNIWIQEHDVQELARYDGIYVVPRIDQTCIDLTGLANVFILPIDKNWQNVSSTKIREQLSSKTKNHNLLPLDNKVVKYIIEHELYSIAY